MKLDCTNGICDRKVDTNKIIYINGIYRHVCGNTYIPDDIERMKKRAADERKQRRAAIEKISPWRKQ